jgi:hypothetical protein
VNQTLLSLDNRRSGHVRVRTYIAETETKEEEDDDDDDDETTFNVLVYLSLEPLPSRDTVSTSITSEATVIISGIVRLAKLFH